jgi:hypothetical protein
MLEMLYWMIGGHVLMDYPLQPDILSKGKNRHIGYPGVPWSICLTAHAWLHGAAVAFATGSIGLGLVETVLHWIIDWCKCEGGLDIWADQALHLLCKVVYIIILATMG